MYRKFKNPLVYPGDRLAGFDPTHPIAKNMVPVASFSAVATGQGIVNLMSGARPSAINGTVTPKIVYPFGPVINIATGANNSVDFAADTNTVVKGATFAAILSVSTVPLPMFIMTSGNGSFGFCFGQSGSTGALVAVNNIGGTLSSLACIFAANVPYFIAASYVRPTSGVSQPVSANFVMVNLLTGQTFFDTITGTSSDPGADNGTLRIGNRNTTNQFGGNMAAAMYTPNTFTIPQLLFFAADPWLFWYPPDVENTVSDAIAINLPPIMNLMPQILW